uniref:Pol polyprotein n=1 Tax=Cajanus cajan TaxID=3821 RepID=A0A151T8C3_CAJCA|nr:Pol polyprotein [Cajanus cajan]
MCVNYTDLNKACPKDAYPLPSIDRLMDKVFHQQINYKPCSIYYTWKEGIIEAYWLTSKELSLEGGLRYKLLSETPFWRLCYNYNPILVLRQFGYPIKNAPTEELVTPFIVYELNQNLEMLLLGPFPLAKGQVKFLPVAIDYFTKWIEAGPFAKITAENVQQLTWKNMICRYGLPHALVTDNGRQFVDRKFKNFLQELAIRYHVTSVEHTQTNG